jgi:hypothetical protein
VQRAREDEVGRERAHAPIHREREDHRAERHARPRELLDGEAPLDGVEAEEVVDRLARVAPPRGEDRHLVAERRERRGHPHHLQAARGPRRQHRLADVDDPHDKRTSR